MESGRVGPYDRIMLEAPADPHWTGQRLEGNGTPKPIISDLIDQWAIERLANRLTQIPSLKRSELPGLLVERDEMLDSIINQLKGAE